MAWTAERTTINQRLQFGAESTSSLGTSVSATKQLLCYDLQTDIQAQVTPYTPTGFKYVTVQIEDMEHVEGTLGGQLDYSCAIYPLASAMGSTTPVAHLASATAKDWIFTPPVTGSIVPQTFTIEQGDAVRAHKFTYGLFSQFGYKIDRKTATVSGKLIAQAIQDGITMTASPTAVALNPVVGKHVSVWLDPTSGALGTTQLNRILSVDFTFDNVYGTLYTLNRANTSWVAHVDLMPKCTVKLKVEADTQGMGLLSNLQTGSTQYLRIQAQGPTAIASDGPGNIFPTFQHDMAIKIGQPAAFADQDGVFAIEWDCPIVEDSAWNSGQSQKITVTNLITAL